MLKFTKSSVAGLMSVALVAGAGYFALRLPATTIARPTAAENTHAVHCPICRLPYYGLAGQPSLHGLDPHEGEHATGGPSLTAR
jgi:hypothetical protein